MKVALKVAVMVDSIGARRIRHRRRHLLAGLGAIVMLLWLGTGFAGAQEATPQCETEEDLYLWGDHGCELGLLPDASLQEMLLARCASGVLPAACSLACLFPLIRAAKLG